MSNASSNCDIAIIGGGIVGTATAWHLSLRHPGRRIVVLEKEAAVAAHQTGRNSGVIHSGIYYKPGSLKARNCRTGIALLKEFCTREGIPFQMCGKVIVATEQSELPRLQMLFERGRANGVDCELIERPRLLEIEPHCAGIRAIHIRDAGIISYAQVCRRLAEIIQQQGHRVVTNARVSALTEHNDEVVLQTSAGEFHAQHAINCAGLHSDRVTALTGLKPSVQIVPFRGEFFELKPEAEHLCRTLIYPVPDEQFPFLGVHLTRVISGGVHCGPNAVLAWSREGYRKTDLCVRDLAEALGYAGFRRLALKHWRMGLAEMWRSWSKAAFVRAVQRLVPEVRAEHLKQFPAGVRAQAVSPDGKMVDDFAIEEGRRVVHVINSPSPAATASLSVGAWVADRMNARLAG